jgi:hypothetical protein
MGMYRVSSNGKIQKRKSRLTWLAGLGAGLCLLASAASAPAQKEQLYSLFFPNKDRVRLGRDERRLSADGSTTDRVRIVTAAVLAAPPSGLAPVSPPGLLLRQVFVDGTGTAFVDLAFEKKSTGGLGASEERLALWAIVNSICFNFPEIKEVKILVGGDEARTLFGHVDISRPLLPDDHLVDKNGQ